MLVVSRTTGDSAYSTYLKNPTTIDAGLAAAGATRIGELGKADARKLGEEAQDKVIANWIDKLWLPLAQVLAENELLSVTTTETLKQMQARTIPILVELDSDYAPPKELMNLRQGTSLHAIYILSITIALIAILAAAGVMKMSQ